jgi:PAS domain S-box-containing protein
MGAHYQDVVLSAAMVCAVLLRRRSTFVAGALLCLTVTGAQAQPEKAQPAKSQPVVVFGDANFAPYEYMELGTPKGVNIDLLNALGRVLGRPIDIHLIEWAQGQAKVREGQGDALSMMAPTPEREALYAFSEPTLPVTFSLFVRNGDAGDFDASPLTTKRIGVTPGGLPLAYFEKQHPDVPLMLVTDYADGVRHLLHGEIDALAAATWAGNHFLRELNISGVRPLPQPFAQRSTGIAVLRSNPALLAEINEGLRKLKQDGTLDRIFHRVADERVLVLTESEIRIATVAGGTVLIALVLLGGLLIYARTQRRALAHEIVERQDAENAQRESEERLQLSAQVAGFGTFDWDLRMEKIVWSDEMYRIFGLPPDERVTFDRSVALFHPDDRQKLFDTLADVRNPRGSGTETIEYRIIRPDGDIRCLRAGWRSLFDGHGDQRRAVRMIGAIHDITDYRTALDTLAATNADLERRVEERTEQLLQTQKMEAVGQLTSGVAHDFNNLLQGINGCLTVLEYRITDPASRGLFDAAQQSIGRGARLTQHLLAFARRQALTPKPTNLEALLDGMRPLLERTMGGLIQIGIDVAADAWSAMIDPTQLELAILNLAINARDAMPVGGLLSVQVANATVRHAGETDRPTDLPPADYVIIRITDTGIGMEAPVLRRVFEPFFTTKETGKGSGLGLSMVHGMAAQSGGGVRISSAVGSGTTVEIYLPRALRITEPAVVAKVEPAAATTCKVLLVDDNQLVRLSVAALLKSWGHDVIEADSGSAALKLLQAGISADILITDYAMPGMNGVVLAREAHGVSPDLPVLLITGYVERPADLGDMALLRKPFPPADLAAQLAKLLPNRLSSNVVPFGQDKKASSASMH